MDARIINREKAKYRVIIRDLETGKSRSFSLSDGDHKIEQIEKAIEDCFSR